MESTLASYRFSNGVTDPQEPGRSAIVGGYGSVHREHSHWPTIMAANPCKRQFKALHELSSDRSRKTDSDKTHHTGNTGA